MTVISGRDRAMRTRISLSIITLILMLVVTLVSTSSLAVIDPRTSYVACPNTQGGLATGVIRNVMTGKIEYIIIYNNTNNKINIIKNDISRDIDIISVGGRPPHIVALDTANGSILILRLANTSNSSLLNSVDRVFDIKIQDGFIEKAYAYVANKTIEIVSSVIFVSGNASVRHVVWLNINMQELRVDAKGQPYHDSGLMLVGSEKCMAALTRVTNDTIDIAPVINVGISGTSLYHIPVRAFPPIDWLSFAVIPRLAGTVIVSHPANATDRLMIIDVDKRESKASIYITDSIPNAVSIEPKAVFKINETSYMIYSIMLTSEGSTVPVVSIADLGLSPHVVLYEFPGKLLLPLDSDTIILIDSSNIKKLNINNINIVADNKLSLGVDTVSVGITLEPVRLTKTYNVSISIITLQKPANQTNTATGTNTTATTGETMNPPPAPPSPPPPGENKAKPVYLILIIVVVIGLVGVIAYKMLQKRAGGKESLGEPVFRF